MHLGEKIRLARLLKGYSQEYLATLFGHSQNWMHNLETGKTEVTAEILEKAADLLDVSLEDLLQLGSSSTFLRCVNSGNHNTYHIQNDLEEIKVLLKSIADSLKNK
jgi:transcriptional regulator with XRE-family HTH domain